MLCQVSTCTGCWTSKNCNNKLLVICLQNPWLCLFFHIVKSYLVSFIHLTSAHMLLMFFLFLKPHSFTQSLSSIQFICNNILVYDTKKKIVTALSKQWDIFYLSVHHGHFLLYSCHNDQWPPTLIDFYPTFMSYLNSWERASISLFNVDLLLNKGTTGTIFPWLGIEPGTSYTQCQHSTTRLSRRR